MADATYTLKWDEVGEHIFETGVSKVVLFVYDAATKAYKKGVVWNGVTSISQSPQGGDASNLYADNMKYLTLRSTEDFKATIEAFNSPEEFDECDGTVSPATGLLFHGQARSKFALCYQTLIGNDTENTEHGFKLHIIYGATAAPSQRQYQTVNNNPDAMSLSWELETDPIVVEGYKPVAHLEIDSTKFTTSTKSKLDAVLTKLYGNGTNDSELVLPAALITMLT